MFVCVERIHVPEKKVELLRWYLGLSRKNSTETGFIARWLISKNIARGRQDISTGSTEFLQGPTRYSYNDLKVATANFSDESKLGRGVFGEVYKGTLKDGGAVAIKKTFIASSRRKTHFYDEIKIISNAWNLYESGTLLNLMDEKLDPREYAAEHAVEIIEIALMCTQQPSSRPAMSEVVMLLSEKSLQERQSVKSTILEDELEIEVATMEPLASNATASTSQLSGC
ncbi:hypothetical protein L1887_11519 [Cichorium endivia]|nr:hypothetical protein L1887_11519 [Cichorium endivia]